MRVAICRSHCKRKQGAGTNPTEWEYYGDHSSLLKFFMSEYSLIDFEVKIFNRRSGMRTVPAIFQMAKEINAWKADIVIECHFNSARNEAAEGHEVLLFARADEKQMQAARIINNEIVGIIYGMT